MPQQNSNAITQSIADLREQIRNSNNGPDVRTVSLVHEIVRQCRVFTGANDMAGLGNYLTELDKQSAALGEAVGYQRTGAGGAQVG